MRRSNSDIGQEGPEARRLITDIMAGKDELLSSRQVSELFAVRPHLLSVWRNAGIGPPFIWMNSKSIRYSRRQLEVWVASGLQLVVEGLEDYARDDDFAEVAAERQLETRVIRNARRR